MNIVVSKITVLVSKNQTSSWFLDDEMRNIFLCSLPDDPQPVNKPAKAAHRKYCHANHQSQCPPFRLPKRSATRSALPAREIRVRLRRIHAKRIRIVHGHIPRLSSSAYRAAGIVDDERVRLDEQRVRDGRCLVSARVPGNDARIVGDSLVRGDGIELLVGGAGCHYIYGGGRAEEGGVVPAEGYVGADFVVLGAGGDGGCHEGDAACWICGIIGC